MRIEAFKQITFFLRSWTLNWEQTCGFNGAFQSGGVKRLTQQWEAEREGGGGGATAANKIIASAKCFKARSEDNMH